MIIHNSTFVAYILTLYLGETCPLLLSISTIASVPNLHVGLLRLAPAHSSLRAQPLMLSHGRLSCS